METDAPLCFGVLGYFVKVSTFHTTWSVVTHIAGETIHYGSPVTYSATNREAKLSPETSVNLY